jgi:hypothetical protein
MGSVARAALEGSGLGILWRLRARDRGGEKGRPQTLDQLLAELRRDVRRIQHLNPDQEPVLGALPADELEEIWWRLVVFMVNARTDREREQANIGIQLFQAAGLIQAGPEGGDPKLMWRQGEPH